MSEIRGLDQPTELRHVVNTVAAAVHDEYWEQVGGYVDTHELPDRPGVEYCDVYPDNQHPDARTSQPVTTWAVTVRPATEEELAALELAHPNRWVTRRM